MSGSSTDVTDVVVVGAGIIGAATAWRAAGAGLRVVVLDPTPGDGATRAAAGMLAPTAESWFGEEQAVRLGIAAGAAWPAFARDLAAANGRDTGGQHGPDGQPTGLRDTGTLVVAYDTDDLAELHRQLGLHRGWGLDSAEVTLADARRREPLLGPRVAGAAHMPSDHVADPRATHAALLAALDEAPGVTLVRAAARRVLTGPDGAAVGVLDDVGTAHRGGAVVLAAGWRTDALVADLPGVRAPVRPVRGQTLRLDAGPDAAPQLVVRGLVQGRPVYVVPRAAGTGSGPGTTPRHREVVVGATSEEGPDDRRATAGGVFALLRDARALLPGLDEAALVEATPRARPGTPDNLPLIGPTDTPGLHLATGHYRNGVLLAPLTADAVVAGLVGLVGLAVPPELAATDPRRFTTEGARR